MIKVMMLYVLLALIRNEDDYYKVLELTRNATKKDVKKAFNKLSKKYHPDINKAPDAEKKFTQISEAYDVLIDEDKRRKYDRYGKEGLKETPGGRGGFDPFDFFGRGEDQEEGSKKADSLEIPLLVSLEDIYNGSSLKIMITKKSVCSHCRGSGAENPDDLERCDQCGGRGIYLKTVQVAPGFI